MRVCAVLRTPDGREVAVGPGELVGRSHIARLRLDDPRVSEGHALLSLRGERLLMLALRGRLVVEGRRLDEVSLRPGLVVHLARDLAVEVVAVRLPRRVWGVEGPGLGRQALPGATGLALGPHPRLVHPTDADAVAWLWTSDGRVQLRTPDTERTLAVGDVFTIRGQPLTVVEMPLHRGRHTEAGTRPGGHGLRIVVRYDTVHIHRPGREPAVLEGLTARMVGELVAFDAPVGWKVLSELLWPEPVREALLRKRFDNAMWRLRQRLEHAGIRRDLVRTTGVGLVELLLDPDDVVEDQQ